MKTIAVFGASGNTGKPFIEMALKDGYAVKALVRTPAKLGFQHPNLKVIQGDLTDSAKVEETIHGTDAVISLIGGASGSPNDIKVIATRHIVAAMQKNNMTRFIRLGSAPFGVFAEGDKLNFGRRLMASLAKTLMWAEVDDERQSVRLTEQSELDWTVVRAPFLNNQPPKGNYRVVHLGIDSGSSITRTDLAAFVLDELKNAKYIRQMPLVSN
jgi:putative NADH-flavin reductase